MNWVRNESDNPGNPQCSDRELKMQEAKIVADFLFPPDQQSARAIRPRVGSLDDPAPRFSVPALGDRGFFTLPWNVSDVVAV